MALVARASTSVRNKNIIIFLLCAVFLGMFAYDGYYNWPTRNDRQIPKVRDQSTDPDYRKAAENWQGWEKESPEHRRAMDRIMTIEKSTIPVEEWKSSFDINLQRYIVWGLIVATGASIWWFIRCQRRRTTADESGVSPAPGVVIPWEKITVVDNTRWKSTGIVDITYLDDQGHAHKAKFDDYEVDREPLLAILDQLSEKAVNAEFIPKEEAASVSAEGEPPQNTPV